MAVVKADAYGHGIDIVGSCAYEHGIRDFGVATTGEGETLRTLLRSDANIYILSPVLERDAAQIVSSRLTTVVSSHEMLRALSREAIARSVTADVHLDIDTGMGRSGVAPAEAGDYMATIAASPGVRLTGLATHFTSADEDPDDAARQHGLFTRFLESLGDSARGLAVHASNSPASLVLGRAGYHSMIRPGLLLYGIEPAPGMFAQAHVDADPSPALPASGEGDSLPQHPGRLREGDVRPVMSVKARITLIRDLPPGATISYGKTYRVPDGGGRYATVAIGYGDGYPRRLSGVGYVLLHGRRAPIRGRVCMDQMVVDVSHIPDAAVGHVVVVIGTDGDETITAGAVAAMIGATPHEISTCLTGRLPRICAGFG
jgi:alanine racemase